MESTAPQTDGVPAQSDKPLKFSARIPYQTEEEATIVMNAVAVDAELRPEFVAKEISVEGNTIVLYFEAVDLRTMRAAVGTFCDLVRLASLTLEAFPPLPPRE